MLDFGSQVGSKGAARSDGGCGGLFRTGCRETLEALRHGDGTAVDSSAPTERFGGET